MNLEYLGRMLTTKKKKKRKKKRKKEKKRFVLKTIKPQIFLVVMCSIPYRLWHLNTVKPFYSGHHRDLKIAYFTSKTYSRVLGYSEIQTKVCQKVGVGSRKILKTIYYSISSLYGNLKATG